MKGVVVTDFDAAPALNAGCRCNRGTVLAYHVQDLDLRTDLEAGEGVQTLLLVMHNLDKTVFADECIEATQWTDMAAPTVLLTKKIKEKDGDKKKPAKAKTEDDTSVCNTDRTDHLKGRQREEKREEQADAYDPVADVTAEGEGMLFFINVQFSSECSCCLGNNVNRADPGAEETAADNTVDKKND